LKNVANQVHVDFRAEEPIYLQIARQIEELVGNGVLDVGDQLPTVREMATELSINFNTVARAYRMLDESRIISTQRGRGTYIWEKPSDESRHVLKEAALENLLTDMINEIKRRGYTREEVMDALKRIQKENQIENFEEEKK
jgi:GntR family transcriptional regulator